MPPPEGGSGNASKFHEDVYEQRDFVAHFLFDKRRFGTKIRDVGRKYMILRLASYLKSDDFGRKYAMLDENT